MTTYVNPGLDASGNGNNWTTNNINWTSSGSTFDTMTDVPTLTSATTANYCVLNPLKKGSTITLSEANLKVSASGTFSSDITYGTIGVSSGKWYWEATSGSSECWMVGVIKASSNATAYSGLSSGGSYAYGADGNKYNGQSSSSFGSTYTSGDVLMCAYDADSGKIWFGKNGTWQASGNPSSGTNEAFSSIASDTWNPLVLMNGTGGGFGYINFGQRPFAYTPPTGFVALNTYNLPTPTIGATASSQANKYFDATLYTGNSTTTVVTNAGGFQPDFVWIKDRSDAYDHALFDAVRGTGKWLKSNSTDAETGTTGDLLGSFNSNGFTVNRNLNGGTNGTTNTLNDAYVGWQWRASNATGVTNTAGSITSTVSANTTSGFSVVTWTGVGGTSTVGHGLGVAPSMIIAMPRSFVSDKYVYHASIGAANYVSINLTSASASTTLWNSTSPTSSVFTVNGNGVNQNTSTYVAYCFSEVAGFSKFGSYTGNGSTDGPFIYTGFRPKYLLIKNVNDGGAYWGVFDGVRNPYNTAGLTLFPNSTNAETSNTGYDLLSNGFKVRDSVQFLNTNGQTMIYAAFAESPFKYANAR